MSNSQGNSCPSNEEPQAGSPRFGPPHGGNHHEECRSVAPALLYFCPGSWNNPPQWSSARCLSVPPCERATQEQAADSAAHSSTLEAATADERCGTSARWTDQQTSVLIALWKENLAHVESARNAEAWQKILAEVNKAGPKKSMKQCRDKLRNLKMQYKNVKQAQGKEADNGPVKIPRHYDELDEVLGTRAVIAVPGVLQADSPTSKCLPPGPHQDDGQHVSEPEEEATSFPGPSISRPPLERKEPGNEVKEEDVPLAAGGRKRTAATPIAADEAGKKKCARKTRKRVTEEDEGISPLQQRLLELQERQMEMFAAAQRRTEDLLLRLETEQRRAEREARARDHDFLLKLAELFSKK